MYGCTKTFSELLGCYYQKKYSLDFRSLRYPQVVSDARPTGGSGDYITDIFYHGKIYNSKCQLSNYKKYSIKITNSEYFVSYQMHKIIDFLFQNIINVIFEIYNNVYIAIENGKYKCYLKGET
jgi:hypothetical protein